MGDNLWDGRWEIRGGAIPDTQDIHQFGKRMSDVLATWSNVRAFRSEPILDNLAANVDMRTWEFTVEGTSSLDLEQTELILTELAVVMRSVLKPPSLEFYLAGNKFSTNHHSMH